jgi:hypothetical protein
MCFSATASFGAAALTGSAGVAAMARAHPPNELPLAAIPLIFAVQQACEGFLWLSLAESPESVFVHLLVGTFSVIALMVWPIWVPVAVGMIEPQPIRRLMIYFLLPLGVIAALYSALDMWRHPYTASLAAASICYTNRVAFPEAILALYVLSTCIPSLLSSHKAVRAFGGFVAAGLLVSTLFYTFSLISVWCFFAAMASIGIYALFQHRLGLGFEPRLALPHISARGL